MRSFELIVVLVRSIYDSNIGASSRAMANMGSRRLILINPKCEITYAAQQAAATGQEALQNRTVYQSWEDFHAHESPGISIAFTTKLGKARQVQDFEKVLTWIKNEEPQMQIEDESSLPIYLIFGPEDWGLSNSDLELTNFNVCLPTFGDNPSLNLAQAVLLALFQLRLNWGGERMQIDGQKISKRLTRPNLDVFPDKTLEVWLKEMGFDTQDRGVNAYAVLKRMLLHNIPSKKEIRILETVLQQGIRKLREYNELRKNLNLPFIEPTAKKKSPAAKSASSDFRS